MVTEAVAIKVSMEDEKERKEQEKKAWKKDVRDLDKFR